MPKKKATRKKKGTTRRKSSRKKTGETKTTRKVNKTDLKLDLRKNGPVDGGPAHTWDVVLKSNRGSVTAGAVLARNETEARNKAKRLLRTMV